MKNKSISNSIVIGVFKVILLCALIGGAFFIIYIFSTRDLSNRETTLLGIMMTLASVLAGWLVTHVYSNNQTEEALEEAQERSRENLRTYALKASEKVTNLSNELQRLAAYLEEELAYTDYQSPEYALRSREERIESAIHMMRTLKSVNDTSLSDWAGVIGEELDEKREEEMEKQEEIRDLVDKVDRLVENQQSSLFGAHESAHLLQTQLDKLRNDVRHAAYGFGVPFFPSKVSRLKKTQVTAKCPNCANEISYRQKANTAVKAITCKKCESKLVSKYDEPTKSFTLSIRKPTNETIECPNCKERQEVLLDAPTNSFEEIECKQCGHDLRIVRTPREILVKDRIAPAPKKNSSDPLDETFLLLVKSALPEQPWPTGVHRTVAEKIGSTPQRVSDALEQLMARGDVLLQIHGKLYAPLKRPE